MQYNKINNIVGWIVFLIATAVYFLTLEDTASLWDCGEYITAAYKLEVGHPPGAPLFMMLGRMFSFFADPEMVAIWINRMSALSSSFTILFLYWSITLLGKKISWRTKREWSLSEQIAVIGSGVVGALAYTFSDSFWFSAVEGEVYAMSSLFTAIVFWAILKWDEEVNAIKNNELVATKSPYRWMILIMFLFGLAIGVHLLGLLAIPAITYIVYFNQAKNINLKGIIICGFIGVFILGFVQEGIIPGIVALASSFEVGFVNSLGLPFYSGTIFFFLLVIGAIVFGLNYAAKKNNVILSTALWSLTVLLIGYGSFATIVIRSNANTPLDENDPENLVTLHAYLKREQYGSWPVLYGPYWNSQPADRTTFSDLSPYYLRRFVVNRSGIEYKAFTTESEAKTYAKTLGVGYDVTEKYYSSNENVRKNAVPKYVQNTFLPRMYYSMEPGKIEGYKLWSGYTDELGEGTDKLRLPTFRENLTYMFNYQVDWMYWRYFMWNFAGRQNDIQGTDGREMRGNWKSGFDVVDEARLGSTSDAPFFTKSNPSNNSFFFIPLILGLIGLIFHYYRASKDAFVVTLLFLFTGFAIILYLNQKPYEPRERDYAYAASFYAFAIWIGLSVQALFDVFKGIAKSEWKPLFYLIGALGVITLVMGMSTLTSWIIIVAIGALMIGAMMALKKFLPKEQSGAILATVLGLIAPLLMASQGWDDHNRNGKTSARDLAHNYLMSCEKNSILFTAGDNDTFPLWYYQEVEGKRTDVRVCNLSLMQMDWYTNQMKMKAYDSDPLPIKFKEDQILMYAGSTDQVYLIPTFSLAELGLKREKLEEIFKLKLKYNTAAFQQAYNQFQTAVNQALAGITAKDPAYEATLTDIKNSFNVASNLANYEVVEKMNNNVIQLFNAYSGQQINANQESLVAVENAWKSWENPWDYLPIDEAMAFVRNDENLLKNEGSLLRAFPSKGFILPIDVDNAVKSGMISKEEAGNCEKEIRFTFEDKQALSREQVMILDILANNDWKRATYFSSPAGSEVALALLNTGHLRQNGMAWEISPIRTRGGLNPDRMYKHLMETYTYGDMKNPNVLTDYYARRQTSQFRSQFAQLAEYYINAYDEEQQEKQQLVAFASALRKNGEIQKADSIQRKVAQFKGNQSDNYSKASKLILRSLEVMPPRLVLDYGEPNISNKRSNNPMTERNYRIYQDGSLHDYVTILFRAKNAKEGIKLGMEVADQLESVFNYFAKSDAKFAGRNPGDFSAAMNAYLTIHRVANDPLLSSPNKLGKRTQAMVDKLYKTTLPMIYSKLEAQARENGEVVRQGSKESPISNQLFELRSLMEDVGMYYGVIEEQAPAVPQQNAPVTEQIPAEALNIVPGTTSPDTGI